VLDHAEYNHMTPFPESNIAAIYHEVPTELFESNGSVPEAVSVWPRFVGKSKKYI